MARVTATEFKNNIGTYSDAAMKEPVIITSHHRDRLVPLSAEEYLRLTGENVQDMPEARKRLIHVSFGRPQNLYVYGEEHIFELAASYAEKTSA